MLYLIYSSVLLYNINYLLILNVLGLIVPYICDRQATILGSRAPDVSGDDVAYLIPLSPTSSQ
jgi:hypothetical protein